MNLYDIQKCRQAIVECWEDSDIQEWIDENGTKTGLRALFRTYDNLNNRF